MTNSNLIVEEMSDGSGDDDDNDGVAVMYPDTIEYAESERSHSRSRRHRGEVDESVMCDLEQLNCSDDEPSEIDEAEHLNFMRRRREERGRKRMTSGSIGKRTFADSMGSDSEPEDPRNVKRVFTSADGDPGPYTTPRRMFTRGGGRRRGSVQVVSEQMPPPPPRIDEIEEPDSSNEEILVNGPTWSRELPYYECVMDIDSS